MRNNPVVIAGSGRSGTTWLLELICSDRKYFGLFEPLNPRFVQRSQHFSYNFNVTEATFEQREFFDQIFEGRIINDWIIKIYKPNRHLSLYDKAKYFEVAVLKYFPFFRPIFFMNKTLVIKFIRANLLLKWIRDTYAAVIIFVIRNPVDVVRSMLQTQWFNIHQEIGFDKYIKTYNKFSKYLHVDTLPANRENIYRLAMMWMIENIVPLEMLDPEDACVIPYEYLCKFTRNEFSELFEGLGISCDFSDSVIKKPSSTSVDKTALENDEEKRIQLAIKEMSKFFGFDLYNDKLLNVDSKLYRKWSFSKYGEALLS